MAIESPGPTMSRARAADDHVVLAAPRRRRKARRRTRLVVGGSLVLILVIVALGAPLLAPRGYDQQDLTHMLTPPAWAGGGSPVHPLGTDRLGRDMVGRLIWAGRVSLSIGTVTVLLAMGIGVLLGLATGYYGGALDAVIMRVADVQLAFPHLLLAIAVMALLGPSVTNLVLLLALPGWILYARTVRASVLSLRRQEFVEAAIAIGASDWRVIARHLLPNIAAPIIVIGSLHLAQVLIAEASLSFLGVGIRPPTPSWGLMLSQGREYLTTAWWLGVFPGMAIMLSVFGINLVGDGLRDALDPRQRP